VGPWINWLFGLFEIFKRQRLMKRPSPGYMGKAAIMSDAVHECPFRAVAAKMSQGLPDCQRDLLYQFFPDAGDGLITERQPRDGRSILGENASELGLQSLAVFAHDCGQSRGSICD
jgi:hypothetical protein